MMTAEEMRNRTDQSKAKDRWGNTIDTYYERQNNDIMKASDKGLTFTLFNSNMFMEEMKEHYKELGYSFRPVGYHSGVWQDSEYICW